MEKVLNMTNTFYVHSCIQIYGTVVSTKAFSFHFNATDLTKLQMS